MLEFIPSNKSGVLPMGLKMIYLACADAAKVPFDFSTYAAVVRSFAYLPEYGPTPEEAEQITRSLRECDSVESLDADVRRFIQRN